MSLERYTRRWQLRSDKHLQPTCLADHVRAKRLKENLTAKELGLKLGIPGATIKRWEMHLGPPSKLYQVLLVEYLGFDPELRSEASNK